MSNTTNPLPSPAVRSLPAAGSLAVGGGFYSHRPMQTIPDTYRQAGHPMQLVKREGNTVMYKAAHSDYWEVHVVHVRPAERIVNKDYPEREVLAGNEEFGTRAWACVTADRAERRFREALIPVKAP